MIIGSAQSLSPALAQSSQDFRTLIENSKMKSEQVEMVQRPLDYELNQDNIEERRDSARKSAVYAFEVEHTQNMIDTYVDASQSDDEDSTSIYSPDPADVYNASLKYSRQQELISAFEQAGQQKTSGLAVDIVV